MTLAVDWAVKPHTNKQNKLVKGLFTGMIGPLNIWSVLIGWQYAYCVYMYVTPRSTKKNKFSNEPTHDKANKMNVRPAKTQISLGIRPVWSESSLSAWRNVGFLATHWVHSEDTDQTGRMPRLIWVKTGRTLILFVLTCPCSKVPAL